MVKATAECSPAATAHGCLVGGKGPLRSQKARGIRGRLCEPHMEEADLPGSGRPYDHAYCKLGSRETGAVFEVFKVCRNNL